MKTVTILVLKIQNNTFSDTYNLSHLREFSNREKLFIVGELIKEWFISITILAIAVSLVGFIFWHWWTKHNEKNFLVSFGLEMASVNCMNPYKTTSTAVQQESKTQTLLIPRKIMATELIGQERVITPDVPFIKINCV